MRHEEFCPNCERYCETKAAKSKWTVTAHGHAVTLLVRESICSCCGQTIGSDEDDQRILDAVHAAYLKREA